MQTFLQGAINPQNLRVFAGISNLYADYSIELSQMKI